jgi:hypothetical protein
MKGNLRIPRKKEKEHCFMLAGTDMKGSLRVAREKEKEQCFTKTDQKR